MWVSQQNHPLKLFQTFFIWTVILDIHVKFPLATNHVARASCLMPHRSCGKSLVQLLDSVRAPANRKQLLRCFEQIKNQPTYQTDHGNQKNDRSKVQRYFWGFWGSLTPWLMWKWLSSMAPLLTHLSCHWLSTSTTKASKKFHQHFQNVGQICMYIYIWQIYIYDMCTVYKYIYTTCI